VATGNNNLNICVWQMQFSGLELVAECLLRRVPVLKAFKVERSDKQDNKQEMKKHRGARLEKCNKYIFLTEYNVSEIREIL